MCVHVPWGGGRVLCGHTMDSGNLHACTADESVSPTCPHRPSIPSKCFNGHLVGLISLVEMMAV